MSAKDNTKTDKLREITVAQFLREVGDDAVSLANGLGEAGATLEDKAKAFASGTDMTEDELCKDAAFLLGPISALHTIAADRLARMANQLREAERQMAEAEAGEADNA